ncbi:hypothetical protein M422DRAFT_264051 [Sphaerobolus stellatus SS14]|uniref:Uncharacterized protein n=1 Tax=Sphaerobolus stellatus (strain SS14) TaxID=990650 RepID=A0A0C9V905_SPHS4|nr:hypothetical protein M422DRAFT_264051 [Sphaerobolus stellatus SS14]
MLHPPTATNSIRLARTLLSSHLSALCEWNGRARDGGSTGTSDDDSEPDTAVSASGFVAAVGSSHYPSKPIPASTQFRPGPSIDGSEGSGYWDGNFEGASDAGTKAAASNPADMKTTGSGSLDDRPRQHRPSRPTRQRLSPSPPPESQPQSTPRSYARKASGSAPTTS